MTEAELSPEQEAAAERAMAGMEAQADLWAVEVDLPAIIANIVSVSRLSPSAPQSVRDKFIKRQTEQIDAFLRQAFMEGWVRGGYSRQDYDEARRAARKAQTDADASGGTSRHVRVSDDKLASWLSAEDVDPEFVSVVREVMAYRAVAVPLEVDGVGYTRVRIDTEPDADGWCFCTPANHPNDVLRGLKEEWEGPSQFFGQVIAAPVLADAPDSARGEGAGVVAEIAAERKRQVEAEGWTVEHDDEHETGQMASAAACYASPEDFRTKEVPGEWSDSSRYMDAESWPIGRVTVPSAWPWDGQWWKPGEPRRNLIKAAALLVAEIERLDRAAAPNRAGGEA